MEAATTTCYRHPSYETYVSCTRCERFICPDCMREAAVGHHCAECVKEGQRSIRQARTLVGGRVARSGVPVVTYTLMALNIVACLGELVRPGIVDRFGMPGAGPAGPDGGRSRRTTSRWAPPGRSSVWPPRSTSSAGAWAGTCTR